MKASEAFELLADLSLSAAKEIQTLEADREDQITALQCLYDDAGISFEVTSKFRNVATGALGFRAIVDGIEKAYSVCSMKGKI